MNGVDLSILEGEIFGLLGPNGAGKTTTISILATLLVPDDGQVRICSYEVRREAARVKPLIGFVPQELALYPTLSAWDNLTFFGRIQGLRGALLTERVASALALVALTKGIDYLGWAAERAFNLPAGRQVGNDGFADPL